MTLEINIIIIGLCFVLLMKKRSLLSNIMATVLIYFNLIFLWFLWTKDRVPNSNISLFPLVITFVAVLHVVVKLFILKQMTVKKNDITDKVDLGI